MVEVYHYLANNFKNEFMFTFDDAGLNFSDQILSVETSSIMSDIRLHICNYVFSFEF